MPDSLTILGLDPDGAAGLHRQSRELIQAADFLAGAARHLEHFPEAGSTRFLIKNNLAELVEELRRRLPRQRCVVLASGDPLFYGIGKYLSAAFGPETIRVEPARSSMQLAFARAGLPWQDADLASIHGRGLRTILLPLLGRPLIGLFTNDGDSPAAVARFLLERGLKDYEAILGENLGADDERVTRWPDVAALIGCRFAPLNYLILRRQCSADYFAELQRLRGLVPGVPDETFVRPTGRPEVMTRQEVRAVVLARLAGAVQSGAVVWDIGTGLGTVAVELAVLRPYAEVVAVERDADRASYARQNRERFGAYNVRVVEGEAPEVLREEEAPSAVFIGGSGARLAELLDLASARLRGGGRLLANFVTLEHLALMLQWLRERHWPAEVVEVHVSRGDSLAGLTGLKPQRGVFLVGAEKPAESV